MPVPQGSAYPSMPYKSCPTRHIAVLQAGQSCGAGTIGCAISPAHVPGIAGTAPQALCIPSQCDSFPSSLPGDLPLLSQYCSSTKFSCHLVPSLELKSHLCHGAPGGVKVYQRGPIYQGKMCHQRAFFGSVAQRCPAASHDSKLHSLN